MPIISFADIWKNTTIWEHACYGIGEWTGPLVHLILLSVMWVDRSVDKGLNIGLEICLHSFLFSPIKVGRELNNCLLAWTSNIIEWMFPLWVRFWVQYLLLLQYEILEKLVTYIGKTRPLSMLFHLERIYSRLRGYTQSPDLYSFQLSLQWWQDSFMPCCHDDYFWFQTGIIDCVAWLGIEKVSVQLKFLKSTCWVKSLGK